MARDWFYLEDTAEHAVTTISASIVASLGFSPVANSTYWLIASGQVNNSTNTRVARVNLYHSESATIALCSFDISTRTSAPIDYVPWMGIAQLQFGASPGAHGVRVELATEASGDTANCKNTRLILLQADAADMYVESLAAANVDTTAFTAVATLSVSRTGSTGIVYAFMSAAINSQSTVGTGLARIIDTTSGDTTGGNTWRNLTINDNVPVFDLMRATVTTGAVHTFQYQHRTTVSGRTLVSTNTRLLALPASSFQDTFFNLISTSGSTTASSDFTILTLSTGDPIINMPALVIGTANVAPGSITVENYWDAYKDSVLVNEYVKKANAANFYFCTGLGYITTLTAGVSHEFKWTARSGASSTINWHGLTWMVLYVPQQQSVGATGTACTCAQAQVPVVTPQGF